MFKYLFKRDTLFATFAVFFVMGMFTFLPINTHFLDPIHLALSDFDYNDLAYSKMHKNEDSPIDTNIVVVNIGGGDRMAIAQMLVKIGAQKPKAVGLDVLFNSQKDSLGDATLFSAIKNTSNLVLAYNYKPEQQNVQFASHSSHLGFANFIGEEGGVIRHFSPFIDGQRHAAFGVAVVKLADPESYKKLAARNRTTEIINYTRKANKYLVLEGEALIDNKVDATILTDKIVLVGYVSPNANDVEDKHFSPLNTKYTGRTLPDMNGIFIHANIISMISANAYVHRMPLWLMWSIAFLLCWLHMALFIKDYLHNHIWFHLLAKIAQIISALFFVYLGLLCFSEFNTQMNMTATLVAIILAVDVLYFYEALVTWLHKKYGFKTIFNHHHD